MTYRGVIDEVKMLSKNSMMPDIFKPSLNKIAETLEMETGIRTKGEWLFKETTNAYYVTGQCSRCTQRNRIDNFCPNCGADMRGEKECENN